MSMRKLVGRKQGGSLAIINSKALRDYLSSYPEGQEFVITISLVEELRSNNQNKLYWKWCELMADELGWNGGKDEVHEYLKKNFNNDESTTDLTTERFNTYMQKVSAFAGSNQITLPYDGD